MELNRRKTLTVIKATFKLRKESLKKIQVLTGFKPMTSAMPVQCSTIWAIKPTGSWSYCEFVIYPWRMSSYIHIQNKDEQAIKLRTTGGASVGLLIACLARVSVGFCASSLHSRPNIRTVRQRKTNKRPRKRLIRRQVFFTDDSQCVNQILQRGFKPFPCTYTRRSMFFSNTGEAEFAKRVFPH